MAPRRPQNDPGWAQDGPKTTQDGPKTAQDGPLRAYLEAWETQKTQRRPSEAQELAKRPVQSHFGGQFGGHFWTLLVPKSGPSLGPFVDVFLLTFWAPKCGPNRPKMAPGWPKMVPAWPQDAPKLPQDTPKIAPRWPKNPQDCFRQGRSQHYKGEPG